MESKLALKYSPSSKKIDYNLIGLKNNFCFLDYKLIVSKVAEEDHFILPTDCLTKFDAHNLSKSLQKCYIARKLMAMLQHNFQVFPISNHKLLLFLHLIYLTPIKRFLLSMVPNTLSVNLYPT